MKNTVTFTTDKGNIFLYSPFRKQFLLCHPLTRHFFQLEKKGTNLPDHLNQIRLKGKLELRNFGIFTYDEVRYQYSKYRFLQKNEYFTPVDRPDLEGTLVPERIEESFSKLQRVIFETSEENDHSCIHCNNTKFYTGPGREKQKMNPEDAKNMLGHILSKRDPVNNPELTVSFYGKEPLENFALISGVISYLNSYPKPKPVFKFTLSGNGSLLSKYKDYLTENSVEVVVRQDDEEKGSKKKEIAEILENYSGYVFNDYGQLILRNTKTMKRKNIIPTGTCVPFSLRIFLTTNGIVLPCEFICRIFEIGRVSHDAISIDTDSIAAMYNRFYSKIKSLCEQCFLDDNCMECLFNTRIETDYPECEFFTDEAHFVQRLSKNLSLIEKHYPLYLRTLKEVFHDE